MSVELFLKAIQNARYTAVLTGAGVSTASGIPDFRSPDGLYSKISQETFELDFLLNRPADYYKIAIEHIHPLDDKQPNPTHSLLAELERRNFLDILITQNIDRLHQKAGSQNVIEFHGDAANFHCLLCSRKYLRSDVDTQIRRQGIPNCSCGGLIRPDIVFFGDPIPLTALMASQIACGQADLFIAMGTSLQVHPAGSLVSMAKQQGAKVFILNRGSTAMDYLADQRWEVDLTDFCAEALSILPSIPDRTNDNAHPNP